MKSLIVCMAALSFAAPAFAQEWPKQDWGLLQVKPLPQSAPASSKRDGGAYPPEAWMTGGDAVRLGGPAPGARQTVAVNLNAINRVGDKVEVQYFVWPEDKSGYTELTSRIDCSKTGKRATIARAMVTIGTMASSVVNESALAVRARPMSRIRLTTRTVKLTS